MCGICGIYLSSGNLDRDLMERMNESIRHRGPDEGAIWYSAEGNAALGFRRLAVVDTSPAASQPIVNEDGSIAVVCNGEIYNHAELKVILQKSGHIFKGSSDAEVVVHGFEEWGTDVFSLLNGMFAIAIMEPLKKQVILARDRFGIKPLYYQSLHDSIVFASEVAPFHLYDRLIINPDSLINFLIYRYVPSPNTIFKTLYKLPPAHYIVFNEKGLSTGVPYWDPVVGEEKADPQAFLEELSQMLDRSIGEHLHSAVPIGAFLSGGYDSSYIALAMKEQGQKPDVFSLGFEDWEMSEETSAALVAEKLGLPLHIKRIGNEPFLTPEIVAAWDEPIADISIIPSYHLSSFAAATHKVVMSGDGADELFAGYNWYYEAARKIADQKRSWYRRNRDHEIAFDTYWRYAAMGLFDRKTLFETLETSYHDHIPVEVFWFFNRHFETGTSALKSLQLLDIRTFLPELILPKMDRASMAHSLEVRVPFLDHRIAEFILKHSSEMYFNNATYKIILRKLLENKVPDSIIHRKKQGFVGPDSYYERSAYYTTLFEKSTLVESGIIKKGIFNKLIKQNCWWHLWKLAVLELWFRRYVK